MDAVAESEMAGGVAGEVQTVGVGKAVGVAVGGGRGDPDRLARGDGDPADGDVLDGKAADGQQSRALVAEELLGGRGEPGRVPRRAASCPGCWNRASTAFPISCTVFSYPAKRMRKASDISSSSLSRSPSSRTAIRSESRSSAGSLRLSARSPVKKRSIATTASLAAAGPAAGSGATRVSVHTRKSSRCSSGMPSRSQMTVIGRGAA